MTQPETASPEPSKQLAISLIRNVRKGPNMDAGKFLDDMSAWNDIRPLTDPSEETTLAYLRAVVADEVRRKVLEPAFQERVSEEGYLQLGRLLGLTPPEPKELAGPVAAGAPGVEAPRVPEVPPAAVLEGLTRELKGLSDIVAANPDAELTPEAADVLRRGKRGMGAGTWCRWISI